MAELDFYELLKRFSEPQQAILRKRLDASIRDQESMLQYLERIQPQPEVSAAIHSELPKRISRKCCMFKSCGNTSLYFSLDSEVNEFELDTRVLFTYKRESNDDIFFQSYSVEGLVEKLNDPLYYPLAEEA